MTIFYTSDSHYGHKNIITLVSRPFKTVEEMNKRLIDGWNSVVQPSDIVYHLGDVTLGNKYMAQEFLSQLNGNIIILSNPWHHDKNWLPRGYTFGDFHSKFSGIQIMPPMLSLKIDGFRLHLSHYPIADWDRMHSGGIHLHGHSHGTYQQKGNILDVGVDCHNFRPITLEEILRKIKEKE